jgi:hypothetical protein
MSRKEAVIVASRALALLFSIGRGATWRACQRRCTRCCGIRTTRVCPVPIRIGTTTILLRSDFSLSRS